MNVPQMRSRYSEAVRHELQQLALRTEPDVARQRAIRRRAARPMFVTAVVALLVVVGTVGLLHARLLGGPRPAAPAVALPTPSVTGVVVTTLSSESRAGKQTYRLNTDGSAFVLTYTCTGGEELLISGPHIGTSGIGCEAGVPQRGEIPVDANVGVAPISISTRGDARWIVTVSTLEPTMRGFTYTPAPSPAVK